MTKANAARAPADSTTAAKKKAPARKTSSTRMSPPTKQGVSAVQKPAFFITPIGAEGSPERSRADELTDFVLQPLLEDLGYALSRGDRGADPGQILESVLRKIVGAELVVADISGRNPNVFYELAIAHAAKRPTLIIMQEGDGDLPFDVAGLRAVAYDISVPSGTQSLRHAVRSAIEHVEEGRPCRYPLQDVAFGGDLATGGTNDGDDTATELSRLSDEIRALGSEVRRLPKAILDRPRSPGITREPLSTAEKRALEDAYPDVQDPARMPPGAPGREAWDNRLNRPFSDYTDS